MNVKFDLKEILTDIKHSFDKLEVKIDRLKGLDKVAEDVSALKTNLARSEAELKGEIKVNHEKIDDIAKRIELSGNKRQEVMANFRVASF